VIVIRTRKGSAALAAKYAANRHHAGDGVGEHPPSIAGLFTIVSELEVRTI
jgi:aspartate carbamoyltransferase catalytic subunit